MPRNRTKFTKQRPPDADAVGTPWRTFIACPLPEAVQANVTTILEHLGRTALPIRWIAGNSAHLTLHFLGELPVETVEILRLGLSSAVAGIEPIELRIDGAGAFPSITSPRVVWLGLNGDTEELTQLHRGLGRAVEGMGIPLERERFRPHITLGRVRDELTQPQRDQLQSALTVNRLAELVPALEEPFEVSSVDLMRSVLSKGGSSYTILRSYPLKTAS